MLWIVVEISRHIHTPTSLLTVPIIAPLGWSYMCWPLAVCARALP